MVASSPVNSQQPPGQQRQQLKRVQADEVADPQVAVLEAPARDRHPRAAVRCADGVTTGVVPPLVEDHRGRGGHAEHAHGDAPAKTGGQSGIQSGIQPPLPQGEHADGDGRDEDARDDAGHGVEHRGIESGGLVVVAGRAAQHLQIDEHHLGDDSDDDARAENEQHAGVAAHEPEDPAHCHQVDGDREGELGRFHPSGGAGDLARVEEQTDDGDREGDDAEAGTDGEDGASTGWACVREADRGVVSR